MTATFDPAVEAAIASAALATGVPLVLANAVAAVESGGNPQAIGDNGQSVGLYQLNSKGEGAGMTVLQRQDPYTNAMVALARIGPLYKANPNADPGAIAAAAQRPADPTAYAQLVDAQLGTTSVAGSDPSSKTGALGALGTATEPVSTQLGHGIADWAIGVGKSIGGFATGNLIGLLVAGAVLYIVFAPDVAGTSRI